MREAWSLRVLICKGNATYICHCALRLFQVPCNRRSRLGWRCDYPESVWQQCGFDIVNGLFSYFNFVLASRLFFLYLEVDLLAESGIQVDLELRHLVLDRADLVLQLARLLVDSLRRRRQHLLCLFEADVEEGVADFVSATRARLLAYVL